MTTSRRCRRLFLRRPPPSPEAYELCARATDTISRLSPLDKAQLAAAVTKDPAMAPVLAAVVGLSQERFKTWLTWRFKTAGWVKLGRTQADALVAALDGDFDLIDLLKKQLVRGWTWSDVLARIMAPKQQAGGSVQQGRALEDAVEEKVKGLSLPYIPRASFTGRANQTAPADFAIPTGSQALIAVAVKWFDSTGSKLTDARREIEEMVKIKQPRQYIFAVVDGQGWVRRQSDLRRVHSLWVDREIDGLYPRGELATFAADLRDAAIRVGLLDP
jgi:hypothetical protein